MSGVIEKFKKDKFRKAKAMVATWSDEELENSDDEDIAILTRQVRKFLQKKRRFQGGNNKKFPRKVNLGKAEASKDMEIMYYECKKSGHMWGECPELQKKFKKDKFRKSKAMVATWSDEESDSSEESEDQMANICLMAHEDDSSEVNSEIDTITIE